MSNMRETTFSVPEVSCEHCVQTINGALGKLPGVETVSTNIPTQTVYLKYDSDQLAMDTVKEILDDTGYTIAS